MVYFNRFFLTIALFPLLGCCNLVIVNFGIGNKTAASHLAPAIDREAYCLALSQRVFRVKQRSAETEISPVEMRDICEQLLVDQRSQAAAKRKKPPPT